MLTEKQILEIKEHLDRAQNPIFFYDNDCDGLCSFLILRRYIDRGKGVAVRSFPDLNAQYARKARELNADYVFVLDKPMISQEFVDAISELGLPLVWIDHHNVEGNEIKGENVFIYNSALDSVEDGEKPVTFWAYEVSKRKDDLWLAVIGCIADHYLPDFSSEFGERYAEYWGDVSEPFEAYFRTEIGKIAQAINFGLKDSTTNIVYLQNFLISAKGPEDIFLEVTGNYSFRKKYKDIKKKYDVLLEKAKTMVFGNMVFFIYSGDLSISSDLANELCFLFPDKYIVVAFLRGGIANLSLRGKNVKKTLENVLKKLEDSTGGGHEDAVGARIKSEDLRTFKELFSEEIKKT